VNVIGLLFLAIVFYTTSFFNGDLHQWDVAKVTTISYSKSIRIVENGRDVNTCYCVIGGGDNVM
jgi:hypothetical protein